MTIVSVSLNKKILAEVDQLQKELGFSGRSEIVRAGLRLFIDDRKEKQKLVGMINAVLLITYKDQFSDEISSIRHKYRKIIKTQVHNHTEQDTCLEVCVVQGDAKHIRNIIGDLQTSKKVAMVKLIIP